MRENESIDLTPKQFASVESYARKKGISAEEAATQLARRAIEARYVLPKNRASVAPMRALNRARRDD
ncbi:MAG: hypothetical protein GAK28_00156 [Luteibacter sp.]|uniref:hypothetical protein n=1 Tax=Luteibacter sp. TaxID=1886636 RepID=UPI00137ECF92|nr:hypothetical protein [Luteibacter sp.]KAF1009518.1 MAG: hypothetical protein GAK28_00156 [Luteibacter sp.]